MITVSSRNNKRKILNHFYDNFRNGKNTSDVSDIFLFISIKFDINRPTKIDETGLQRGVSISAVSERCFLILNVNYDVVAFNLSKRSSVTSMHT